LANFALTEFCEFRYLLAAPQKSEKLTHLY